MRLPQLTMVQQFLLWSSLLIVTVIYTGVRAQWNNEFTPSKDFNYWQGEYKTIAYDLATDPQVKEATLETPIAVNQVTVGQFPQIQKDGTQQQRVDRCESCHAGLLNPGMTAENIIRIVDHKTIQTKDVAAYLSDPAHAETLREVKTLGAHPGVDIEGTGARDLGVIHGAAFQYGITVDHNTDQTDNDDYQLQKQYVKMHPFPTFGCTTCHYGSGRDLVEHVAHGDPDKWLQPLMPAKYMDAACAQCHTGYDKANLQFTYLPMMTKVAQGEKLFKDYACYGCHKIEGFSKGNIGPELTQEGATVTYITVQHQLWDPRYKVGTCVMPYFFSYRLHNTDNGAIGALHDEVVDARAVDTLKNHAAVIDDEDIRDSLDAHGYVADGNMQDNVDALVTFVLAQTGGNYAQSAADRIEGISYFNKSNPLEVPITATEGKLLFETSGCYACHHIGDTAYKGPPELDPNGKGGFAGPILNGVGSRHSLEYLIAHYEHPQDFVPGSIMPEFPFSNSERAALSQYDQSLQPASVGARQVSPDEDMPEGDLKAKGAQTATAGYMVR